VVHIASISPPVQPASPALWASKFDVSSISPARSQRPQTHGASAGSSQTAVTASPIPIKDKVTLSPAAKANSLYQQGMTVSQIAATLGQSATAVDSYLSIAASSSSQTPQLVALKLSKMV
jgi:hypothetical protein